MKYLIMKENTNRYLITHICLLVFLFMIVRLPDELPQNSESISDNTLMIPKEGDVAYTWVIDDILITTTYKKGNWIWAKGAGLCTGNGLLEDPYIIADLHYSSWTRCVINNSRAYFIVQNCSFPEASGTSDIPLLEINNCSNGMVINSTFQGMSRGISIIGNSSNINITQSRFPRNDDDAIYIGEKSNNILVQNNSISSGNCGILVSSESYNCCIVNNSINVGWYGIEINGNSTAIQMINNSITVALEAATYCIRIFNCSSIIMDNNTLEGNFYHAVDLKYSNNIIFLNNTIELDLDSPRFLNTGLQGLHVYESNNMTLISNHFVHCSPYFSTFNGMCNVISNNNWVNDVPFYFYANQENIFHDNSNSGANFFLYNCSNSAISAGTSSSGTYGTVLLNSRNITVKDSWFGYNLFAGLRIVGGCDNIFVRNSTFYDQSLWGIESDSSSHLDIQNCSFSLNREGIYFDGGIIGGNITNNTFCEDRRAISFSGGVRNITISYNDIDGGEWSAIGLFSGSLYNNISYNYFHDCDDDPILVRSSRNNTFYNNTFYNNSGSNIYFLTNCYNNTINQNYFDGNARSVYGVILEENCRDNEILNNTIHHLTYGIKSHDSNNYNVYSGNNITSCIYGIYMTTACEWNEITENYFYHNNYGIRLRSGSTNNLIYSNSFLSSSITHASQENINSWNSSISGNYWDNYGGYDMNDDGVGDVPYSGSTNIIDYLPIWDDGPYSIPTFLSTPIDQTIIFGGSAENLEWIITDSSVIDTNYTIFHDNVSVITGQWISESPIIFLPGDLAVGRHNFTIRALDQKNGIPIEDTVIIIVNDIEVIDITLPIWSIIPVNQVLNEGENLSYQVSATDNVAIDSYWLKETKCFQIDASGLITNKTSISVGTYALEIYVNDSSGNEICAEIKIIVIDDTTTDDTTDDNTDDTTDDTTDDDNEKQGIPSYSWGMIVGWVGIVSFLLTKRKSNQS